MRGILNATNLYGMQRLFHTSRDSIHYSGHHEYSTYLDNRLTNVSWKITHVISVYEISAFILFGGDSAPEEMDRVWVDVDERPLHNLLQISTGSETNNLEVVRTEYFHTLNVRNLVLAEP